MTDENKAKNNRKRRTGIVVGDKMEKTVQVLVERVIEHPQFKKRVKMRRKFMAHNELPECKVGAQVIIEETRPLSKLKRWKVVEIINASQTRNAG